MYAKNKDETENKRYSLNLSVTQGSKKGKQYWTPDDLKAKPSITRSDTYEMNGNAKVGKYAGSITYTSSLTDDETLYTARFDPQGGTFSDKSTTVHTIALRGGVQFGTNLPTVTRTGYTFNGWYTSGGTKISEQTGMPASADGTTYFAHWKPIEYRISYELDDNDDGAKAYFRKEANVNSDTQAYYTNYTIETPDFYLPVPQRDGYGFLKWERTDISDSDHDSASVLIKKGTTGARSYRAIWTKDFVGVTCEDWWADYNGNPYSKLGTMSYTLNFGDNAQINSSAWGMDTQKNAYYQWYNLDHYQTKTITRADPVIYRFFLCNHAFIACDGIRAIDAVDATPVHITCDAEITWKDKDGNILKDENGRPRVYTEKGIKDWQSDGVHYLEPYASTGLSPGGVSLTVTNMVIPDGYVQIERRRVDGILKYQYLFKNTRKTDYTVPIETTTADVTQWSPEHHQFQAFTVISADDPRATSHFNSTTQWEITEPDGTKITKDWVAYGRYPYGSVVKMKVSKLDDAKPGWIVKNDAHPWYCPGQGNNKNDLVRFRTQNSWVLDAITHIDGTIVNQDAYGVAFNANGGGGNMETFLVQNTDENAKQINVPTSDASRTLPTCKFTKQNMTFQGWATSQADANAGKVTYKDGAVMPIDFGSGSTDTSNRKHTCQMVQLYAVWK